MSPTDRSALVSSVPSSVSARRSSRDGSRRATTARATTVAQISAETATWAAREISLLTAVNYAPASDVKLADRVSLDTVGAILGPVTAIGLMILFHDDIRIRREGFDPARIRPIVCTHAHGDHAGGAARMRAHMAAAPALPVPGTEYPR